MVKEIISWLKAGIIALVIVIVVREFVMTPSIVKGDSMKPSLYDGDRIIISKISTIDRFDTIAFVAPAPNSDDNFVKRVIGLPGDQIKIEENILFINGEAQDEYYLDEVKSDGSFFLDYDLEGVHGHQVVPEGTLFVLGDNRGRSYDSREFGVIDEDSIIGEVIFRIWPISGIGVIGK